MRIFFETQQTVSIDLSYLLVFDMIYIAYLKMLLKKKESGKTPLSKNKILFKDSQKSSCFL